MSEDSTPEVKKATKAASTTKRAPAKRKPAATKATTAKKAPAKSTRKTAAAKTAPAKKASPRKAAPRKTDAAKTAASKPTPTKETANEKVKADAAEQPPEDTRASSARSHEDFVEELKDKDWGASLKRGIFMLIFGFVGQFTLSVTFFLAFLQFVVSLLVGPPNTTITAAIGTASRYLSEILAYLSFKTDDLPFPFGNDFPSEDKD